ncbi:restriction endonuclease subunit S [Virgibacillus kekensis]|uniref:Restriction endonuclease subunit S n=1 Tax=Virgibacillus kekensis TaxID=202261 RepID=A0ABV9DIJ0_9BACI
MLLEEIASINPGLVLSRKRADETDNNIFTYTMLSLTDIDPSGYIKAGVFEEYKSKENIKQSFLTKKDDVIMRLTYPYTTLLIDSTFEDLIIPSSFAVIRIIDREFKPSYVAWFLNQSSIKQYIQSIQSGSVIGSTNKKVVGSIEIKKLQLEDQERLQEINRLKHKEKQLLEKLWEEKEKLYQYTTQQIIKGESKHD